MRLVAHAKDAREALRTATQRLVSKSAVGTTMYYALSGVFRREHRAVMLGQIAYQRRALAAPLSSDPLLRRNTHRLEKGLIMQPRRATFGAKYIAETVAAFGRATRSGQHDPGELQWANDVLVAYFDCVRLDHEPYRSAHAAFLDITNRPAPVATQSKPYPKRDSQRSSIRFSDFADLCKQRRSTRWYRSDPVPAALIRQAIDVAVQAPSACNRQPYQVVALLAAKEAQTVCGYAMGTTGFSHQVPALLVIVGDLSKLPFARDRHLIYIDSALMAMQLMLALETVGLSTCPINWPDIESRERRIARHLKLGGHQRVIMLMAVGYAQPDGQIPFSQKLDSSRVLRIVEP